MASLEPYAMRHTKLLAHIVEVARAGSIRKAAEGLNLTASAMNRRDPGPRGGVGDAPVRTSGARRAADGGRRNVRPLRARSDCRSRAASL